MASNTYGAIKLSTAEDVGAVLKKKTGSADGYKPKEWADTINLMGLLPVRTASGSIAHFTDGADAVPLKSLTAQILPIQSGTGTPSPSNPRPISGTSVLDIYHSGADTSDYDTTSVNLGQTVYGGSAEVVGGTGEETHGVVDLGSLTWYGYAWGFQSAEVITGINPPATDNDITTAICEQYSPASSNAVFASVSDSIFGIRGGNGRVVIHDTSKSGMSAEEFKEAMSGIKVCFPLATPTDFTFTGQPINSLLGVNNVWTDAGDVAVEYRADINLLISELGG